MTKTLPHEWDEDARCIHCNADGAEMWHLTQFAGYEPTDSDRGCRVRTDKARRDEFEETAARR